MDKINKQEDCIDSSKMIDTSHLDRENTLKWLEVPLFLSGEVVHGFRRGNKHLGIPTANFHESVLKLLPSDFEPGIYFGLSQVPSRSTDVFNMVMSCGWNPFYQNKNLSAETHIIHEFDSDFYEEPLSVLVLGYMRPEWNFSDVNSLISAIKDDIKFAETVIGNRDLTVMKQKFFKS